MKLTVKPLSPSLAGDFFKFFDKDAFSDNPDWAGCYCGFYHFPDPEWESRTAADNRAFAESAIKSGAMHGYLAYLGTEPVGWVNANDRSAFTRLAENEELPEGKGILSIVCFVVAPECRGMGAATKLLAAAIEGARGKYDYVEAYPLKNAHSAALCYHGPMSMYDKAGFEVVKEAGGYFVMRKQL